MGGELDLTRLTKLEQVLGTAAAEIAANLAGEITSELERIEAGLRQGDLSSVAQAAHSARNSVLMFDAQALLDDLAELETAARSEDSDAAGTGAARVRESWPPVRDALARAANHA